MQTSVELPESAGYSEYQIKLIRGTYEAMARVGTQQLSLRGIARELGVSPGLLIYHFGSHENLLIETMRWALEGTVRRIRRHVAEVTDPQEALAALLDAVFIGPRRSRDFQLVYLDLVQYAIRHPSFTGLTELLRAHINGCYAAVIRAGAEAGVFHVDDVDLAARYARAIVEGSVLQWLQEDDWLQTYAALRSDCHRALLALLRCPTVDGVTGPPIPLKPGASAELAEPAQYSEYQIRLIRGTYEAIARTGTQQISLRGIARELGVSPGLLTYHFGTHEKLVIDTMRWALEGNIRRIRRQLAELSDPRQALAVLLDAVFISPQVTHDAQLIYMDLVQYAIRHPSFTGLNDLLRTRMHDAYAEVIRAGDQAGVFQVDDIDLAARQARAIVEGGVLQWLQEDDWLQTQAALRSECHRALLALLCRSGVS